MTTNLTQELEKVFTIDGRGRPKKAELLLKLIKEYGVNLVLDEILVISKRRFL